MEHKSIGNNPMLAGFSCNRTLNHLPGTSPSPSRSSRLTGSSDGVGDGFQPSKFIIHIEVSKNGGCPKPVVSRLKHATKWFHEWMIWRYHLFLGNLHTCIFSCLIQFDWGQSFWATRNPVSSPDLVLLTLALDTGCHVHLGHEFETSPRGETALRTCNMDQHGIWMSLAFSSLKM